MSRMKAIRIHGYGGRDQLRFEDISVPAPGPGELLLRVKAAAVNPIDVAVREGKWRTELANQLPLTLGRDASGTIEAVGDGVTKFLVGDAVVACLALSAHGTYAEYAIVAESEAAFKPQSVEHTHAAALPFAALTAWQALFDKAGLQAGQCVLIRGAAGGAGHFAVQLAKHRGARVIAVAAKRDRAILLALGADEFIDKQSAHFLDDAREFDVVFDTAGDAASNALPVALKPDGIIVSLSETVQPSSQEQATRGPLTRIEFSVPHSDGRALTKIVKLVDRGALGSVVQEVFPLAEAARAHELLETGHVTGKIVLATI